MVKNSLAEQVEQCERSKIEGSFVDFERMPILKNALEREHPECRQVANRDGNFKCHKSF
jgi:hypothetical protein